MILFCLGTVRAATSTVTAASYPAHASINSKLTEELVPAEQEKILAGEMVVQSHPRAAMPLPQFKIYKVIEGLTTEEAMAIFSDFEHQKNYTPNMLSAKETKKEALNSYWMTYEMHAPWPIPNARYTTRNVISTDDQGNYQVYWNQIESNLTNFTEGTVRFLRLNDKTVFAYTTLVEPTTAPFIVKLLKNRFKNDVEETCQAIVKEFLRVKNSDKALLEKQLTRLRTILKG
jgi:hypothetical protein